MFEPEATPQIARAAHAAARSPTSCDGARVGEATAAVTPWPHQVRAFDRLYSRWPPKLLIADEVGLGKTIEAGMLLRQAWLAERARRILTERRAAIALMRANTPIRHLVSRHTRALLRRYRDEGMLSASIADRDVKDEHIAMSPRERELYDAVETYIATTYNQASEKQRSAVGFVMTTYRRRLASSVQALRVTLQRHLATIEGTAVTAPELLAEDVPDDETASEIPDTDELAALEREALTLEESEDIARLLERIARCPPDSKLHTLTETVTRFVDDFAYSGENARSLINTTARASSTVGLRTWRSKRKLRIMPASSRQEVTGLTVNAATGPSVPREKRDRVRAAIHQLGQCPVELERRAIESIRGRVNHVSRYNAGSGARLARLLERTLESRTGARTAHHGRP